MTTKEEQYRLGTAQAVEPLEHRANGSLHLKDGEQSHCGFIEEMQ
jgi:hypothetical protein